MRLAMVVAGAGAMYCGACSRDSELARALMKFGWAVEIFPIYTPLRLESELEVPQAPLRIGGINAFIREKYPRFASVMGPMSKALDSPALIEWASQFAVRTQAADLGQMTVSFLQGDKGSHAHQIQELADTIREFKPDLILLANTLLSGLIQPLQTQMSVPVICQVQGEDGFLDELTSPWNERAESLLREKVRSSAGFLAPCRAHAEQMSGRLNVPINSFRIAQPSVASPSIGSKTDSETIRLGHLSSIRRVKGLDLLIRSLHSLRGLDVELRIRGRVLELDYAKEVRRLIERAAVPVTLDGELPPGEKASFLDSCDFMVLPSRLQESRGIVALESLAVGTPVIAPNRGIFPELAEVTGGVVIYGHDEELGPVLKDCWEQCKEWRQRGESAKAVVKERFSAQASAQAASAALLELAKA